MTRTTSPPKKMISQWWYQLQFLTGGSFVLYLCFELYFGSTRPDFPPELLTKIFLNLAYKSLLRVMAVCVRWNAIVAQDPSLAVHMFKKCTQVYVEPGARIYISDACHPRSKDAWIGSRSHEIRTFAPEPEPLRARNYFSPGL